MCIYWTIYWPQNNNSYKVMMLCGLYVLQPPPQISQHTARTEDDGNWRKIGEEYFLGSGLV